MFVEGLTRSLVKDMTDMESMITAAVEARAVGVTRLNQNSSRSHCIFTIIFTQYINKSSDVSKGENTFERQSHINLIDLAGSERVAYVATHHKTKASHHLSLILFY